MAAQMLVVGRGMWTAAAMLFCTNWYLWNYGFGYLLVLPQAKALMFSFPPRREIKLQIKQESTYSMRIKNQDSDPIVCYA